MMVYSAKSVSSHSPIWSITVQIDVGSGNQQALYDKTQIEPSTNYNNDHNYYNDNHNNVTCSSAANFTIICGLILATSFLF